MRRACLTAILASGMALGACGKEPMTPAPTVAASVSATPTRTPSAAPVLPEAASKNTMRGALTFIQHYFQLINFAQATGQTNALAVAEHVGCNSCTKGRRYLDSVYSVGGHIEGGELSGTLASARTNGRVNSWTIRMNLSFTPQTVVRPGSDPASEVLKGGRTPATFIVTYRNDAWTVSDWFRTS